MSKPFRVGLVGWGAISHRLAELVKQHSGGEIMIAAVGLRQGTGVPMDLPQGAQMLYAPDEIAGLHLDLVIEAASRPAVAAWGEAALRHSRRFAVSSASAFCDDLLLERLLTIARTYGSQIVLQPGALGGIDALSGASILSLDEVSHTIIKPPAAWRGTAAEKMVELNCLRTATELFRGTARHAAESFPQNANVTIVSALAGVGLDRTRVVLVADPAAQRNCHRVTARGDFGSFDFVIENRPLANNRKSSEMAALSLFRVVQNQFRALIC